MAKTGGKGKKVGRGIKSPSHMRYNGEGKYLKNKARRKVKHEKNITSQKERKQKRLELLELCKIQTKMSVGHLQKQFGTLNIKRLTDILEKKYETSQWYIDRKNKKKASYVLLKKTSSKKNRKKNNRTETKRVS